MVEFPSGDARNHTICRLTLALSGGPQALQARGRRTKMSGAPDARPCRLQPGPLERV